MVRLTECINQALEQRDWDEIVVAQHILSAEMPLLAEQGAWTPEERQALAKLRQAHFVARGRCAAEMALLEKQMGEISMHRDGLLAYAQSSESEER